MNRKNLTCVCCGAPINRTTMRCEYCGTQYEIKDDIPMLRIESFQNPVKEYKACVTVGDEVFTTLDAQAAMQMCIERLAHEMLPAVMAGMSITQTSERQYCQQRIEGRLKIVIPKN